MKLGAMMPIINEWRFVPAVCGQLFKICERVVLLRGSRSFSGAPIEPGPVPELDPRIEIIEGNWPNQATTRNAGMAALSECDYVLMMDTDEIIVDEDLKELNELCKSHHHEVVAMELFTYWKTPQYRIDPPERGTRKIALKSGTNIVGWGDVTIPFHTARGRLRHLSYVRTDAEVREKIRLSGHSPEIIPTWYERVWRGWDSNKEMQDLHPVHPGAYKRAIHDPDPPLDRALKEFGCA